MVGRWRWGWGGDSGGGGGVMVVEGNFLFDIIFVVYTVSLAGGKRISPNSPLCPCPVERFGPGLQNVGRRRVSKCFSALDYHTRAIPEVTHAT